MVDAERRLLANALQDLDNQYFALMSDTYAHTSDFSFLDICTSFCALMSFVVLNSRFAIWQMHTAL